jgi:hypothetical protein
LILRLEVRQFPLLKHRDDGGHFPKPIRCPALLAQRRYRGPCRAYNSTMELANWLGFPKALACLSIIDKTSRRSSHPRSHIASVIPSAGSGGAARAHEARPGTPKESLPLEGPLIAGWNALFACDEICV